MDKERLILWAWWIKTRTIKALWRLGERLGLYTTWTFSCGTHSGPGTMHGMKTLRDVRIPAWRGLVFFLGSSAWCRMKWAVEERGWLVAPSNDGYPSAACSLECLRRREKESNHG